jgi:LysR family hydrogen peroxide-inducible transcriptional activator
MVMKNLTLKHLRYFDALARHGHFGHAASACGISQPALSVQIKELETLLGSPLVERSARKIRLTGFGEDLLSRGRNILVQVNELNDLVRVAEGPFAGKLRLGVIPTVAPYLLPKVITALAVQMPGVDLLPRESVTKSLIADLLDTRLDAAIVALPISEPALEEFPLFEEDFVLVRPIADASKPIPSPNSLTEARLLLLEEGHCFRDQALSFCGLPSAKSRDLIEGSSLSTLVQMVGAGMGLTLIPEMAIELETRGGHVSVARFASSVPSRRIGMVWRKSNPLSQKLNKIGAIVKSMDDHDAA